MQKSEKITNKVLTMILIEYIVPKLILFSMYGGTHSREVIRAVNTVTVDEEEMNIWEHLDQIVRRQKKLLALCSGDPRGPLYAIPDHPDVAQLQSEFDTLAQDYFVLARRLPNRKFARAAEQRQSVFKPIKEMMVCHYHQE